MEQKQKDELQKLSSFQLNEITNSLYKEVKDNPKDKIELELGDSKDSSKLQPQAPSSSTVYLQVYNRILEEWETITSNNSANANTKFTLSGSRTDDVENYFDNDYIISCRVYQ